MNRNEQIKKLEYIKSLILSKYSQIRKMEEEVEELEQKYSEIYESTSLAILLFTFDTSSENPYFDTDFRETYIYYCPDFDEVRSCEKIGVKKNDIGNHFVPNTLDLREYFENIKNSMPEYEGIQEPYDKYKKIIDEVISELKKVIEYIFSSNNIKSWDELRELLLKSYKEEKYISKKEKK